MIQKVLVAGGPSSFVYGPFEKHLNQVGLEVIGHTSGFRGSEVPFNGIPKQCEGVILISDMTSHSFEAKVKTAAKARGVPFVGVPRKWSLAEPVLRRFNFISSYADSVLAAVADNVLAAPAPTPEKPTLSDLLNLGDPPPPNPELTFTPIEDINAAPPPEAPKEETPMTAAKPTDIHEVVFNELIQNPNHLLDEKKFITGISEAAACDPSEVEGIVKKFRKQLKDKTNKGREWKYSILLPWLIDYIRTEEAQGRQFNVKKARIPLRAIFGMGCLPFKLYHQAYAEVVGPWAKEPLIRYKVAESLMRRSITYKDSKGRNRYEDVAQLIKEGHLKGYRGRTSMSALREYHRAHLNPDGTLIECCPHPDWVQGAKGGKWRCEKGAGKGRVVQGCTSCGGAKPKTQAEPAPAPVVSTKGKRPAAPKPLPATKPLPSVPKPDASTDDILFLTKAVAKQSEMIDEMLKIFQNLRARVVYLEERELASRQRA